MGSRRFDRARVRLALGLGGVLAIGMLLVAAVDDTLAHVGRQNDGTFIVSTGQQIVAGSIAFPGRPSDIAVNPVDGLVAVMKMNAVFLCNAKGIVPNTQVDLGAQPGFHGLEWTPDGTRLIASTASGHLQIFTFDGFKLSPGPSIALAPTGTNAVPGGFTISKDGKFLFATCTTSHTVAQVDLASDKIVKTFPTLNLPFTVRLSEDEKTMIVSDWGGRLKTTGDPTARSAADDIVVDGRGATENGFVTVIDINSGVGSQIQVGLHPTDIAVRGNIAWVANSMSDTISEIDLGAKKVVGTIPLTWNGLQLLGAMPTALLVTSHTLYVADGGDNALAEIDLTKGTVKGYHPCGFYPIAVGSDGKNLFVLNSKGEGSVADALAGKPAYANDFEGTVSVINPKENLTAATAKVAAFNHWGTSIGKPKLAVYNGAITHVLYIIKENRTYDEVCGDMEIGNGDPKLCDIGAKFMPNHQQIARDFTLFDNAYVSGTNSAEGHAWTDESLADDYLEHFYVGYSRTYPFDGADAMAISTGGCIWDAAIAKHKTFRDYGEFAAQALTGFWPHQPKSWFDIWADRSTTPHKFIATADTAVAGLKPYINHHVQNFPLRQSDQDKADIFIQEYNASSKADNVPDLTMLSLPCDHTAGVDPNYPQPGAMFSDNDLALGRVVEAVSHSPQWKNTCIFVIEDDAQSGPDHVDGHRTSFLVISPYNKRHTVDSNLYTTTNMVRSIEVMLGLDPMNRFDLLSKPIDTCFTDTPDLTPYVCLASKMALDAKNPGYKGTAMTPTERYWAEKNRSLDWSHLDGPDSYWLNRIIWQSLHKDGTPYPSRPGETPGHEVDTE